MRYKAPAGLSGGDASRLRGFSANRREAPRGPPAGSSVASDSRQARSAEVTAMLGRLVRRDGLVPGRVRQAIRHEADQE
jgi:hypothetical protein